MSDGGALMNMTEGLYYKSQLTLYCMEALRN